MIDPPEASADTPPEEEQQPPQSLNRALYLLTLSSFFFPFAAVRGCSSEDVRSFTGFELMEKQPGALLIGVLALTALFFALSFRHRVLTPMRRGLVQAIKALFSALATLTTILATEVTFLFDRVGEQIGYFMCLIPGILVYLLSMSTAVQKVVLARRGCQGPPALGLILGILLGAAFLLTAWLSEPNGAGEIALGLLAGVCLAAPLILMAMLAGVRYRLRHPRTHST